MPAKKLEKVALVTGGARRIGAAIVRNLHSQGMNVVIHHHISTAAAKELEHELNLERPNSALALQTDLHQLDALPQLIAQATAAWQRLDVLINNASNFYPTPIADTNQSQWQDLMAINLAAPFFLAQAAVPELMKQHGGIINITAIHAERPLKNYPVYNIAKAGLAMMTKTLARELAPQVRVNAVAPGVIIWPEANNEIEIATQQKILERIPLKHLGNPEDIAKAVWFLVNDADYMTGQTITVDGGRVLFC